MASLPNALHADPWVETLVDLPELNREASQLIEDGVANIRRQAREGAAQLRTDSLVLLGPPGTGKTHLFSRVRKTLGPRALFVHLRPLLHAGITPAFVLSETVVQLSRASYGARESQADSLVGSLIGYLENQGVDFPAAHLSALRESPETERSERLEAMLDRLLTIFPEADDVFVERLLQVPFAPERQRRALLAWLSGADCDPSQLARIGAAASLGDNAIVRALRTLACVAALGAPLVLVFDQLENLVQRDAMEERITQYGNLIAELVDTTRGVLVVQMALDSEWESGIRPRFNLSQQSRVAMKRAPIALPTAAQGHALLELWCKQLPQPEAPFPWPLTTDQVRRAVELPGITPRMLLAALKEAHDGVEPSLLSSQIDGRKDATTTAEPVGDSSELAAQLSAEWEARLRAAHERIDQAESRRTGVELGRLCDGILQAAELTGRALRGASNPYIQLEPSDGSGRFVAVIHQGHHASIGAALDRVLQRPSTTPGVVLREQWRPLSPSWKSTIRRQQSILTQSHLTWYDLTREETARLLALEEMLQLTRSRDICDASGRPVSEEEVTAFLRHDVQPASWPLVQTLSASPEVGTRESADQETSPPEEMTGASEGRDAEERRSATERSNGHADSQEPTSVALVNVAGVLSSLRVASVERVIREARRLGPDASRAHVIAALQGLGEQVKWFGRSLVAWSGNHE